jgi:predicted glycoside hydrolase/deacetylase ChbG (UPF0249 family)
MQLAKRRQGDCERLATEKLSERNPFAQAVRPTASKQSQRRFPIGSALVGAAELLGRLGLPPGTRAVIVSADGLGECHACNEGVQRALTQGIASSASLMVPGPWAKEAAARLAGMGLGVELTLNAEHPLYRWGPVTHGLSLLGGDAGFPATPEDTWGHADLDEVRRECQAQVERAQAWGVEVTHLCCHLTTLVYRPEFFDVYLELALELNLPLRLPNKSAEGLVGFPFRERALEEGAVFPDRVLSLEAEPADLEGAAAWIAERLLPGLTEIVTRPAVDTPELRALDAAWQRRVAEAELLGRQSPLEAALARRGAVVIGYGALRDAAREAKARG